MTKEIFVPRFLERDEAIFVSYNRNMDELNHSTGFIHKLNLYGQDLGNPMRAPNEVLEKGLYSYPNGTFLVATQTQNNKEIHVKTYSTETMELIRDINAYQSYIPIGYGTNFTEVYCVLAGQHTGDIVLSTYNDNSTAIQVFHNTENDDSESTIYLDGILNCPVLSDDESNLYWVQEQLTAFNQSFSITRFSMPFGRSESYTEDIVAVNPSEPALDSQGNVFVAERCRNRHDLWPTNG